MQVVEKTFCAEVDGLEYCLDFVQLPFGPGLNVRADLCVREAGSPFSGGPRCLKEVAFGEARQSSPGEPFRFYGELKGWNAMAPKAASGAIWSSTRRP